MNEQNYKNHKRYLISYHVVAFILLILLFFMSVYNIYEAFKTQYEIRSGIMFLIASILFVMLYLYCRAFALKAQDRAIRSEENLRHFVLTGKLLDAKISMPQILALRFSPDEEFTELSLRAVKESLSADDIKKSIKNWKADNYRV